MGLCDHPDLVRLADTVSYITEVKHAYQRGIEPQPSIDDFSVKVRPKMGRAFLLFSEPVTGNGRRISQSSRLENDMQRSVFVLFDLGPYGTMGWSQMVNSARAKC